MNIHHHSPLFYGLFYNYSCTKVCETIQINLIIFLTINLYSYTSHYTLKYVCIFKKNIKYEVWSGTQTCHNTYKCVTQTCYSKVGIYFFFFYQLLEKLFHLKQVGILKCNIIFSSSLVPEYRLSIERYALLVTFQSMI